MVVQEKQLIFAKKRGTLDEAKSSAVTEQARAGLQPASNR